MSQKPLPYPLELPEVTPSVIGVVDRRWQQHQPYEPDGTPRACAIKKCHQVFLACAMLRRLATEVYLDERVELAFCGSRHTLERISKVGAVQRMNDVEASTGLAGLVRLHMADQVPPKSQIGSLLHLQQRFLHLVLAEVDLAGFSDGANMIDAERL